MTKEIVNSDVHITEFESWIILSLFFSHTHPRPQTQKMCFVHLRIPRRHPRSLTKQTGASLLATHEWSQQSGRARRLTCKSLRARLPWNEGRDYTSPLTWPSEAVQRWLYLLAPRDTGDDASILSFVTPDVPRALSCHGAWLLVTSYPGGVGGPPSGLIKEEEKQRENNRSWLACLRGLLSSGDWQREVSVAVTCSQFFFFSFDLTFLDNNNPNSVVVIYEPLRRLIKSLVVSVLCA